MLEFIISLISFITIDSDFQMHSSAKENFTRNFVLNTKNKQGSRTWNGHFSANNFRTESSKDELKQIKKTLRKVVMSLPKSHTVKLDHLEVRNKEHDSRGMANSHKMIINIGTIDSQEELAAIFCHEMGHVVDLGYFEGSKNAGKSKFYDGKIPIYKDDLSLAFYKLSWKNSFNKKNESLRSDFISGYAMSDPFEDFAEHYIFYRLHGEKFRFLAKKSKILEKKYNFMKYHVFNGIAYQRQKVVVKNFNENIWDTTLVAYGLGKDLLSKN